MRFLLSVFLPAVRKCIFGSSCSFSHFIKIKWQVGFRNSEELKQWISLPSVNQVQRGVGNCKDGGNLLSVFSLSRYERAGQAIFIKHALLPSLRGSRLRRTSTTV